MSENTSTATSSAKGADSAAIDAVSAAIADIAAGKAVLVTDNEDRENEADLIFAADKVSPELVAFMVRYSSGYICVAMDEQRLGYLNLPPMTRFNQDKRSTAYRVTVDAATGTTGISAESRAETIRRLASPRSTPADFTRPGHVVPLCAKPGGVLEREGHTEASVDLARLAGFSPVGVLCEVVSEEHPTDMMRGDELKAFAAAHDLRIISIAALREYVAAHPLPPLPTGGVERTVSVALPTEFGEFTAHGYRAANGAEHLVLTKPWTGERPLVRIHSECLTGDVFGSRRCDCGPQLHSALSAISAAGGVLIYMRGHEGRGIGLLAKLQAYKLQSEGLDTLDANTVQGLPADARSYTDAVEILRDLGISSLDLISNNPAKAEFLESAGIAVSMVHHPTHIHEDNARYLKTKRDRMGHLLPDIEEFVKGMK
ncbi:MAG: 3,4-dihydroxy-2-butanone-4-phosphate synthase [Corynebacterium sp.]|nr:3,4-dihydroxy-2-butanone-4-phosphate synthase [Corynebacterium sp.]